MPEAKFEPPPPTPIKSREALTAPDVGVVSVGVPGLINIAPIPKAPEPPTEGLRLPAPPPALPLKPLPVVFVAAFPPLPKSPPTPPPATDVLFPAPPEEVTELMPEAVPIPPDTEVEPPVAVAYAPKEELPPENEALAAPTVTGIAVPEVKPVTVVMAKPPPPEPELPEPPAPHTRQRTEVTPAGTVKVPLEENI